MFGAEHENNDEHDLGGGDGDFDFQGNQSIILDCAEFITSTP